MPKFEGALTGGAPDSVVTLGMLSLVVWTLIVVTVRRYRDFSPRGVQATGETDSLVEEAVRSELVSGRPKFPASREFTGNFIDFGLGRPNLPSKRPL